MCIRDREGEESEGAAQREQLESERRENAEYLERCTAELTRLNNIKEGLSLKLASRQKALDSATEEARAAQSQCEAAAERLRILRDLENSMDGYNQSVKQVIKAAQNHRLRGIIGPVSSVVTVRAGYEDVYKRQEDRRLRRGERDPDGGDPGGTGGRDDRDV